MQSQSLQGHACREMEPPAWWLKAACSGTWKSRCTIPMSGAGPTSIFHGSIYAAVNDVLATD